MLILNQRRHTLRFAIRVRVMQIRPLYTYATVRARARARGSATKGYKHTPVTEGASANWRSVTAKRVADDDDGDWGYDLIPLYLFLLACVY